MPKLIETTGLISKTMDEIIDFVVSDEILSRDFEDFLLKNKIEITKETELNDVLINYLLDDKMQDGTRVLTYFEQKNPNSDKNIVNALKNNYISVFQIKKIGKNFFETQNIVSKGDITLIPLVKTVNLRGIGLFDYISARVIEVENIFYLLEIFDTISSHKEYFACVEAVKAAIKNPKIAILNNKTKFLEIKKSVSGLYSTFCEAFKENPVFITNKEADKFLDDFYNFHIGKLEKIDFSPLPPDFKHRYFEIDAFSGEFMKSALFGFGETGEVYDIGLFFDENFGLFIIPFLSTFQKILSDGLSAVSDAKKCVLNFLMSDNVPPALVRRTAADFSDFIPIVNEISGHNFKNVDDIINFYKYNYSDGQRFSPVNILYVSDAFSKILGHEENEKNETVGRNDLCPCGSGKKYKKCCLQKAER